MKRRLIRLCALSVGVSIGTALPTACQHSRPASPVVQDSSRPLPAATSQQPMFTGGDQSAAATSGSLPAAPAREARIQQEALLHAALYRAAIESSVGGTRYFLLEPVHDDFPPDLRVDPDGFRARIMSELAASLGGALEGSVGQADLPLAWAPPQWRSNQADTFPGTDARATRLQVRIQERVEDQATVIAEIADITADSQSSRQSVTATWDGQAWRIERSPVRVVW